MTLFLAVTVAVHLALLGILAGIPALTAALLAGCAAYHACVAWGVLYPRSRLFGPNRWRLGTRERVVALTFDDGPHPEVTPRLLDLLRDLGVRATFFVIGRQAARHPEILRRMAAEGHTVGNHTQEHSYLFWALPPARVGREISLAQRAIESASGAACRHFRAPVGLKSPFQGPALRRAGLQQVSWELRFVDHARADPARLARRLRRRLRPGSVVLLHDGRDRDPAGNPAVLEALPGLLSALRSLGYRCEPLR